MQTDPISEFITRMRNADWAGNDGVTVRSSKLKKAIAKVLTEHEFLQSFAEENGMLTVKFRADREPLELKRNSKPGQRIYVGCSEIYSVKNGMGAGILSTSQGIITDSEARKRKLGGELLFTIY